MLPVAVILRILRILCTLVKTWIGARCRPMDAENIIQRTRKLGITLALVGDRIRYAPRQKAPPELVEELRRHKADLVSHLQHQTTIADSSQKTTNRATEANSACGKISTSPIIWETGNIGQIRSLLILREAELVLAKSQLTGNRYNDWFAHNQIRDLEIKIADLRRWLTEVMGKDKGGEK